MEATASGSGSRKVKKAIKKQQKQQRDQAKAAQKGQSEGIKRHREAQSAETLARMDRNKRASDSRHEKESFFSRTFRPKTETEKAEKQRDKDAKKRAKEAQKKSNSANRNMGITK